MASRQKKTAPAKVAGGFLALDDDERKLFDAVAKLLPAPLEPADGIAAILLTLKLAEWWRTLEQVRVHGIAEYGERQGSSHLTPEARRESELFDMVVKLCKEFGLTPASRSRLASAAKEAGVTAPPQFAGFISVDPGKPMKD